jgi:hemerythrin-like domain-containing protein
MGAATNALKDEHREIETVMRILRSMTDKLENELAVPSANLLDILLFFESFADAIHHAKEEDLLLPAVMRHGFPLVGGPLCTYFRSLETIRSPLRDEIESTSALLGERPPALPDAPIPIVEEHQLGRNLIRLMRRAAKSLASGDSDASKDFVRHSRRYLELLTEHIDKEDRCLFVMADETLTAKEQEELLQKFDAVERISRHFPRIRSL